jgi:simple sugar transport system substrate-binding protein
MIHRRALLKRMAAIATLLIVTIAGSPMALLAQDASPVPATIENAALVTPSSRTNQGWDQQGADGLEAVGAERGVTVEIAENGGYDDITPILRDFEANGNELIICHASGYQTVCPEFAAETGIPVAVIENPGAVVPGLVSDIETQAQEAAWLAGYLAGKSTKTGTVAVIVSGEPPTWNFMTVGFAEGLHASRPDAILLYSVIGEAAYDDVAGGKRVTEQALTAGADIVFGMGDGASFGMLQAVVEHNDALTEGEARAWFIDVIGDKRADYAEHLLTSVYFDYTGVYNQLITDLATGEFGQVYTMSVANGGVYLLDLPESVDEAIVADLAAQEAKIIVGEVTVSAIGDSAGMLAVLDKLFPR